MSADVVNTVILSVLLAAAVGGGYYVTQRVQPAELEAVEADIEAIESRDAHVETLLVEEAAASEAAAATLAQWNTRYKVLPPELTSAEVVSYLNALSARGFHRFDLALSGMDPGPTATAYTYQVTGGGVLREPVRLHLAPRERAGALPRPRPPGQEGGDDARGRGDGPAGRARLVLDGRRRLLQLEPGHLGARGRRPAAGGVPGPSRGRQPVLSRFVLETLPPNTDDLVDVDADPLVSVVGGTAVFSRGGQLRQLRAGDRVYLGRVASVDPRVARVTIDLNKGGIRERVELDLETGERYRQHLGGAQVAPSTARAVPPGPALQEAPPAPGTPEAVEAGTYQAAPID